MIDSHDVFDRLIQNWSSPLVARHEVSRFSGGLLHPRTLANLDAQPGKGPKGKVTVGKRVAYDVVLLVEWMRERAKGADDAA